MPADREHIYVGTIPGMRLWSTDYDTIAEWAGGEENVSIMHKRGRRYVLDLSTDEDVIDNQEACLNRRYECGHVAYGPLKRLPAACPECKPVATDGGRPADRTPQQRKDDPYELYCPECGHDGVFDGQGSWREEVTVTRSGVKTRKERSWYQHGCPDCGATFRVLEEETVLEKTGLMP